MDEVTSVVGRHGEHSRGEDPLSRGEDTPSRPQEVGSETPSSWTHDGWLSPARIGAVYVWILVAVIFSVLSPQQFMSMTTVNNVVNNQAVTALMGLALVAPMAAGVFDLSVAHTLGVSAITVAKLISIGWDPPVAVAAALGIAIMIGLLNAVVVVKFKIFSFIGTLATSTLLASLILVISTQPIASPSLVGPFSGIARLKLAGITMPVFYAAVLAATLWFLLEHTPYGRHLYASGFRPEAAKLSGIRVDRLRFWALVYSATVAGAAGIVVTAKLQSGSTTVGPPYLLPAFAAAFVGATVIRPGRFNPLGTIVAVLLLGTGAEGLAVLGAPIWARDAFVGATLLIAVGITGVQRRKVTGEDL